MSETSGPPMPSTRLMRSAAKKAGIADYANLPAPELYEQLTALGVDLSDLESTSKRKVAETDGAGADIVPIKKATAKKEAAPKAAPAAPANANPFKEDTNAHLLTDLLLKGGIRQDIIAAAAPHMKWNPRVTELENIDPIVETDDRLTLALSSLKKLGYTKETKGRGKESYIQVFPPKA